MQSRRQRLERRRKHNAVARILDGNGPDRLDLASRADQVHLDLIGLRIDWHDYRKQAGKEEKHGSEPHARLSIVIPHPHVVVIATGPWSSRPANDNVRLRLAYAFNHGE